MNKKSVIILNLLLIAVLCVSPNAAGNLENSDSLKAETKPVDPLIALNLLKTSDLNRDGVINILDLTAVASRLGGVAVANERPNPDLNGDGRINILDLTLVAGRMGEAVPQNGLQAEVYTPGISFLRAIPNFRWLKPVKTFVVDNINWHQRRGPFDELGIHHTRDFAMRFRGRLLVENPGLHIFKIQSDDGAQVYVKRRRIVQNDGRQDFTTAYGPVELTTGLHDIEIRYFQGYGEQGLRLFWWPPDQKEEIIPPEVLYLPDSK